MDPLNGIVLEWGALRDSGQTDEYGFPTDPNVKTNLQGRFNNLFTAISVTNLFFRNRVYDWFHMGLQHIVDKGFIETLEDSEREHRFQMFFLLKLFANAPRIYSIMGPREIDSKYENFIFFRQGRISFKEWVVCQRLVAEVFYPLYLGLVDGNEYRAPRSMGLYPEFFTNRRHASTIITSDEAGVGGNHYSWMRLQRDRFLAWYDEEKDDKMVSLDREAFQEWDSAQMMQFAYLTSIIEDVNIQHVAATANHNPNAHAAITVLERLKYQVSSTERTLFERLFLAGREFLFGTPRHCNPTEREQCIAETAAKLVEEIGEIAKHHPNNPTITEMSEELIAKLSEPGKPLANRDKREYEQGSADSDEPPGKRRRFEAIMGGSAVAFALGTHPVVGVQAVRLDGHPLLGEYVSEQRNLSTNRLPKTPSVVEEVFLIREARLKMNA